MKATSQKKCFVLMPFKERLKEIYTEVYKPVCSENGIECWRVDEIARPGSITRDIVEGILDADIIIADLTTRNPNVFYGLYDDIKEFHNFVIENGLNIHSNSVAGVLKS